MEAGASGAGVVGFGGASSPSTRRRARQGALRLDGPVYPLKESVKPLGFNFERNFNGIPGAVRARVPRPCPCRPPRTERRPPAQDYWVAPASNDTIDQVAKLFDEWGWKVTVYDGAE